MTAKRKLILVSDFQYLIYILTMIGHHNLTSESIVGIKRIDFLYRSRLMTESASTSSPSFPCGDDHARAPARPRSPSTPAITGSPAQTIHTQKTTPYPTL